MPTNALLYQRNEYLIVGVLFVLLLLVAEVGFRLAHHDQSKLSETAKSQLGYLQNGMIGLLALLLAFTFAMAVTRFDTRTHAVVDEANAIGTTVLRAQMLPQASASATLKLLREYVDARLATYDSSRSLAEVQSAANKAAVSQDELWHLAVATAQQDPHAIPVGLFTRALNEMIDMQTTRDAARRNHVPESALILLFIVTILTLWLVGYASGFGDTRHFGISMIVTVAICLVVLIIIDLDRPRRGLITVSQQPMLDLRKSFDQP